MTPEQLKALMSSKRSEDRRLAAREIVANPKLLEKSEIEGALHRETVPQIRQQFNAALQALDVDGAATEEPRARDAKDIYDQAYNAAIRAVTERVLHQLTPLVGDVEMSALADIPDFEASNTKTRIRQLKLQLEALEKLYNAAKPAKYEQFDLGPAVRDCLPVDLDHSGCDVRFAGPSPLIVLGDAALVAIAVTNGLRNAIEASLPVADADRKPTIVVNWGATDKDYWISILDEGVGYRGSISGAFEIGATTKLGHRGVGLPSIKAAMLSLSGSVELVPKDAGCTLNLNWPILNTEREIKRE